MGYPDYWPGWGAGWKGTSDVEGVLPADAEYEVSEVRQGPELSLIATHLTLCEAKAPYVAPPFEDARMEAAREKLTAIEKATAERVGSGALDPLKGVVWTTVTNGDLGSHAVALPVIDKVTGECLLLHGSAKRP